MTAAISASPFAGISTLSSWFAMQVWQLQGKSSKSGSPVCGGTKDAILGKYLTQDISLYMQLIGREWTDFIFTNKHLHNGQFVQTNVGTLRTGGMF